MIAIVRGTIDVSAVLQQVKDPSAGAVALFLGTVRDHNEVSAVTELYYEAYQEMAEEVMQRVEKEVTERWNVKRFAAVHRTGNLKVGDISVMVAVSSEHRKEAFEACEYAIDTIKKAVPIWKKEISVSGSRWTEGAMLEDRQDGYV